MQIALSQILFTDTKYTYLFVTTHSPFVLYEMDNVNLVRIYSDRKINGISTFYKVPENYEKARKMLNRCLSEAIFANKVLLVEGPSEYMLFSKVLAIVHPFYEAYGTYILPVDGIGFQMYISILDELEIFNAIRTDNDLRAVKGKGTYSVLGFSRCNKYIGKELLPTEQIQENSIAAKRALYNANIKTLDKIRSEYSIFLSKGDLENDLDEVMHDRLLTLLGETSPVDYLQDSKHYHMVKLIEKLSDTDCRTIYNHYNFACLNDNRTHKVVAAITFTIKAAQEIKDRLSVDITQHFIGTNNRFVIEEIIKPFMKDVYGSDYDIDMSTDYSREAKVKTFQDAINKIKNEGVLCSYTDNKKNFIFELAQEIVKNSTACRLYLQAKYFKIYIDEYQDCDKSMHKLFMYLCDILKIETFVVGDEKQSIYIWRGAYPEAFVSKYRTIQTCYMMRHGIYTLR